ncbi:MAG: oligosaccharide flippase family protein [Bacteroidota bacterium]
MNPLQKLFKQTAVYGLATVLPRVLSVLLLPLYTSVFVQAAGYGEYINIYSWIAIFNVFLAYGMETAFFRFFHKQPQRETVISTALVSLLGSSFLFLVLAFLGKPMISSFTGIKEDFIGYTIYILVLDALAIVPFALLRANEKPIRFTLLKTFNVAVNLGFNVFFLLVLPKMATDNHDFWNDIYRSNFEIAYIFISNIIASGVTVLMLLPAYIRRTYGFDGTLWKQMLRYAMPVMLAGVAFTINEVVDKILLTNMVSETEAGKYGACYKLALFMTLFGTAFRMGVEPFFFSHSNSENPQKTYAQITNYFVVFGSMIVLAVTVFIDTLARVLILNNEYLEAISIVPIILWASFCLGIYHNLSVWYKITDRTQYGAYISAVGAMLTLFINFIFIPHIGYMASAIATLIAYASMMVLSYSFGKKYYPIPYNMRKILFYGGISMLFSMLSFYVFNRNLITGSVLLLVFLMLVYKLEGDRLKTIFLKREH